MSTDYKKPLPRFHSVFASDFYQGCKRHELLIQKCLSCGTYRFPPQHGCTQCSSTVFEWAKSSGEGKIIAYTIVPRYDPVAVPMSFWPEDGYPINVVIIELADCGGVHIASTLVDCKPEDIKTGLSVKIVYDDITDNVTLPKFRLV